MGFELAASPAALVWAGELRWTHLVVRSSLQLLRPSVHVHLCVLHVGLDAVCQSEEGSVRPQAWCAPQYNAYNAHMHTNTHTHTQS